MFLVPHSPGNKELLHLRGRDINHTLTWRFWRKTRIILSDKVTLKVTFIHQPAACTSFNASITNLFLTQIEIMEIRVQFHFAWTVQPLPDIIFPRVGHSVPFLLFNSYSQIKALTLQLIIYSGNITLTYTGKRLTNVAELCRVSVLQGLQCLHPLIPGNYYIRVHLSGGTAGNGADIRVKQQRISVGGCVCVWQFVFFRPSNVAAPTHLISPFVPIMLAVCSYHVMKIKPKTSKNWSLIQVSSSAHGSIAKLWLDGWLFSTEAWKMCLHLNLIIAPCTFSSLKLTAVLWVQAAPCWWLRFFVLCLILLSTLSSSRGWEKTYLLHTLSGGVSCRAVVPEEVPQS